MKRWGLRGASVSHEQKHDTGTNVTQPLKPQCFIPVVSTRFYYYIECFLSKILILNLFLSYFK